MNFNIIIIMNNDKKYLWATPRQRFVPVSQTLAMPFLMDVISTNTDLFRIPILPRRAFGKDQLYLFK